ncbi:hypothetical protein ZIOFF_072215 [Zingiber officinale]|uniref:Crooked neck protein n=1 Tax=Zingiber officinale TaxID=94328 RepID=A0A8J5C4U4_ZINOF|nr:hypothetical protein ZIOFF_072215 [Zingiber officinale]
MSSASHPSLSLSLLTGRNTDAKLPRSTRVMNKTAAPIQITAEQILREAREMQEPEIRPPKQKITDSDELADYRLRKRKYFEDAIRRARWNTGIWVKYASWEESQGDFARARSIWERVLDVDYRNPTLWLKYAEMEMRHRFINHARNVWDRAVALLPRVDQLWYKYIHMEEMLGNVAGARQIYERWMEWKPDAQAYVPKGRAKDLHNVDYAANFEKQYGDTADAIILGKRKLKYEEEEEEEEVRKKPFEYDSTNRKLLETSCRRRRFN